MLFVGNLITGRMSVLTGIQIRTKGRDLVNIRRTLIKLEVNKMEIPRGGR